MADLKIKQTMNGAVWVNIHNLSKTSANTSLEVRDDRGFGGRWDTDYAFKGLLEPQVELPNKDKVLNK